MNPNWVLLAAAFFLAGTSSVGTGIYVAFVILERRIQRLEAVRSEPGPTPRRATPASKITKETAA